MEKKCLNCEKEIPKCNKFCSNSCSAKYNNSKRVKEGWISPNRSRNNYCKVCGAKVRSSRSNLCRKHWIEDNNVQRGILTKGELTVFEYSSSNKYQLIRQHAKDRLRINSVEKKCFICGYNNHVEVCHIISIEKFADDVLVNEINSLDNIVYMCPNHHWELDNNILVL